MWYQVPGEGGCGDGKKRLEKEVEKQSPGGSKVNQEMREEPG